MPTPTGQLKLCHLSQALRSGLSTILSLEYTFDSALPGQDISREIRPQSDSSRVGATRKERGHGLLGPDTRQPGLCGTSNVVFMFKVTFFSPACTLVHLQGKSPFMRLLMALSQSIQSEV